ncbi:hypothetical protein IGI04_000764 [Brassica rapa subsp. trilocularis]|uniref:Defensin-like protein n=3 Tax=Brassica TaxID=3705 RepID=A0ABQ8EHH7_BRANA|nr:putative defensin-like protein 157 [Brassica rapa]XP_048637448.1 putative defensin-like protein 157 [Brassica napus]KAG5413197.1 hypothetical protein IGI04_000764 [Brassica rapa subsp. trilocularis]KAH0941120.1 hypothetical protein HID58_000757 [Brassica napus]
MAKLSCSYFFLFMFVFSVFAVAQETKGDQLCTMIIDGQSYCEITDCRLACYTGYNGVGKCLTNSKAGGKLSCFCTYNC